MTIVNTVNSIVFELNGVEYPRTFVALGVPIGTDNVSIVGLYDQKLQLVNPPGRNYALYNVDGNTFVSAALLIQALQPILSGTVVTASLITTPFAPAVLFPDFVNIDLEYRLYNGILEINGSFTRLLDSADNRVFTLPIGFRPLTEKRILAYNDVSGFRRTYIQPDGDVIMLNSSSGGGTHYITCYIPVDIP